MYRQRYPEDPGMHHTPDSHTTTRYYTTPSFWERVKSSLVGSTVGVVLLFTASGLLFWNEGRAVQTARSLDEGLSLLVQLSTSQVAFEENNNKLVHLTGHLQTTEMLYDEEFGIALNVAKLRRKVEMYQWMETEQTREYNDGDQRRSETYYSYSAGWSYTLIRSSSFSNPTGHQNPSSFPVEGKTYTVNQVQVGNFFLSLELTNRIGNFRPFYLGAVAAINKDHKFTIHDGTAYYGKDPFNPQVGDIKVSFEYAGLCGNQNSNPETEPQLGPPDMVSIIAKQNGKRLEGYLTQAGDVLEILYMGNYTAAQIIGQEVANNAFVTWSLRFAGWLLMFVGFGCITQIIVTMVDWIPIVRDIVQLGVTGINGAMAISLSLTVIAIGWIFYRPWLGWSILACALLPFILSRIHVNSRRRRIPTSRNVYD